MRQDDAYDDAGRDRGRDRGAARRAPGCWPDRDRVPRHVDPFRGSCITRSIWLDRVALRDGIRQRLADESPVWVHKIPRCRAWRLYFGAARGARDFIYLAIGTGLGGAAVVNGALATGLNAYAMEVGHLVLHPQGRQCNCGLRGCVEMYVSGKGLRAGTLEWAVTYPDSPLVERGDRVSAHDILAAFAAGDALAVAVMEQAAEVLGTVMSTCASLLNPERFILGGGLGHAAADFWITRAGAVFRAQVLPAARDGVTIVESTVASSAVGASALVGTRARRSSRRLAAPYRAAFSKGSTHVTSRDSRSPGSWARCNAAG